MKNYGFSLLELSIVLVIIGLIAGGIVAGSAMIRGAELRSIISDSQNFQTATMVFRDKYFALPGDMSNATAFWPTECVDIDAVNTCNGNGNGAIDSVSSVVFPEALRLWQHMALAELTEGHYTGDKNTDGNVEAGLSIPESKINSAGYMMRGHSAYSQSYPLAIQFGFYGAADYYARGAVNASEAYSLDKKIDDGEPDTGHFMTNTGYGQTGCVTVTGTYPTATGTYILNDEDTNCRIWLRVK